MADGGVKVEAWDFNKIKATRARITELENALWEASRLIRVASKVVKSGKYHNACIEWLKNAPTPR